MTFDKSDIKQLERLFERQEKSFDKKLDNKVDNLEKSFNNKLDGLDNKVDNLEKRFDSKLGSLEKSFDSKLGGLEKRFDEKLDNKVDNLEKRFDGKLEKEIGGLATMIQNGFLEVKGEFQQNHKRIIKLEQGQDEIKMRLDQAAWKFELDAAVKRIAKLEKQVAMLEK